jgi:hypothetical protein
MSCLVNGAQVRTVFDKTVASVDCLKKKCSNLRVSFRKNVALRMFWKQCGSNVHLAAALLCHGHWWRYQITYKGEPTPGDSVFFGSAYYLWILRKGRDLCHRCGDWNLEGDSRFFENFCSPARVSSLQVIPNLFYGGVCNCGLRLVLCVGWFVVWEGRNEPKGGKN